MPENLPYIGNTEADRQAMLQTIGASTVDELFNDIPAQYRHPRLTLPEALSEMELVQELSELASQNAHLQDYACFLGAGACRHFIPSVVRHILGRSEFATAYTPYQPEISQGTLQVIYEFQSLVCQLTGMEAANSGMYDGASALAEAVLMACRVTGRQRVAVMARVSPLYRQVLATYAKPHAIEVVGEAELDDKTACLVVQYPDFFGGVESLHPYAKAAHAAGALLLASVDPIALGLFQPPGAWGADIVTGEGQPLGNALSFGGPYLGLFACKAQYLRQMPGRIAGKTVDTLGRTGYVLTLQTREQHIRRERATSNICTSEALVALAATVYLAALGKQGLRRVAELCYHKAHYAASRIAALPGFRLASEGTFFKEFVVQCPRGPAEINRRLLEHRIVGGLDVSQWIPRGMLLCVTEMNTRAQIDALIEAFSTVSRK